MTFKQQMEKAIKEYLVNLGFKYNSKEYIYYKVITNKLSYCTGFTTTSFYRKENILLY